MNISIFFFFGLITVFFWNLILHMFFIWKGDPRGRGGGVPLLPRWSSFPWHLWQLEEDGCDKPFQHWSAAGIQMWLWGTGLDGEVTERWTQTGGPIPGSLWRGLVSAVTSEFQSLTCQTVIGLEISWTPGCLIHLGLASVFTSPRGVSQHCFVLFAKGNRKMKFPSSSSPHSLFPPQAEYGPEFLGSAQHSTNGINILSQTICDFSGLEINLIWLALIT